MIATLILLLSISSFHGGISTLPRNQRYSVEKKDTKRKISRKKSNSFDELLKSNQKINELLQKRAKSKIFISDSTDTIHYFSGDALKGTLINSIVSTNVPSTILVSISDQKHSLNYKVFCTGITQNRRVVANCAKLITSYGEFSINAKLLDTDGTFGLRGEYYSSKEEKIATAVALEVIQGVTTVNTVSEEDKIRDSLLKGMNSGVAKASSEILEDTENIVPKVYVNSGKEVVIQFLSEVKI